MATPTIVWFRQDLRVEDQPALLAAAAEGPIIAVYVLDDESPGTWKVGGAQRWWLHHSLASLRGTLKRLGSRLILRRGQSVHELERIANELGTGRVHAVRHYEPWWRRAEEKAGAHLELVLHHGDVLVPPDQVQTAGGAPFKIYTPYWRALQEHLPPSLPRPAPKEIQVPSKWPESDELDSWALLPTQPNWAAGFTSQWAPGEDAALERFRRFACASADYQLRRDLPSDDGTSRLSPHLHFGEISPRYIWHNLPEDTGDKFRKELAWRDFSRNVMLTQPAIGERAGRPSFETFPWRTGAAADADFKAWSRGRTGYPIVDAGMRQLWATGWMHNRVRMLAASFLVKHLLIDWRCGAAWFWDTLVDADYGNNGQNWQWIAGVGVDSQPLERIMAPTLQSKKFDAADYIRRWVPQLVGLNDDEVHEPRIGRPRDYPEPIVGHRAARERALSSFKAFSSAGGAAAR
jgi:deoxyribodipyrimidine photo-lyase